MKKILFALLTTLFVSAMPLQAAYALADDANPKEACLLFYKDALPADVLAELEAQNGSVVELEGVRAQAFLSRVEDLVGKKAPFTVNRIIIVTPNNEETTLVNIAYFSDDCMVAVMHLPPPVVEILLSPLEKKPGERVD